MSVIPDRLIHRQKNAVSPLVVVVIVVNALFYFFPFRLYRLVFIFWFGRERGRSCYSEADAVRKSFGFPCGPA